MKSDRLVSLLLLLQSAQRRTAWQLAQALEVSERTIYRDVDALALAGIPVYTERGADGGIALAEGYRKALTNFGDDEVRALFVSGSAILADLGLGTGLDRALEKLRGAFSDVQRHAAQKAQERVHIDQRRWNDTDAPVEKLALLRRAVWDDRRIELGYEDRSGERSHRECDPFGLVSKAGVWYLVARTGEGFRSFRVDRVTEVTETAQRFERPLDFNLDAHWRGIASDMRTNRSSAYPVTIRVEPSSRSTVCAYWSTQEVYSGDSTLVRLHFPNATIALHQVLSWGNTVDVVEPDDLREAIVAHARGLLDRYGAGSAIR